MATWIQCVCPTARRQFQISCLSMDICRFGGMLGVMHNALVACYSSLHIEKLILQLIHFFSVFIKLLKYICGELVYTGLEARWSASWRLLLSDVSCLLLVTELSNFRLHTDMSTKICSSMSDRHNITDSVMHAYDSVRVKRNDASSI
jgi:hypothetical protein